MERKTMGGFMAALRKANGMTQKELAEKLNVSDKTVSRWERDEGSPDLSAIPVIAEIFGITCDELLRGERKSPDDRGEASEKILSEKGEKQRRRLLEMCISKYRSFTYISVALSVLGLISAAVCSTVFSKGLLGFFTGAAFFAAAIVCQLVSRNNADFRISDSSMPPECTGKWKRESVRLMEISFGVAISLFAFTLPLLITGSHTGLVLSYWLIYGSVCAAISLSLYMFSLYFINGSLVRKDTYYLDEKALSVYNTNHRLKARCFKIAAAVLAITAVINIFAAIGIPMSMKYSMTFDDCESFVAYMETEKPRSSASDMNPFITSDTSVPVDISPSEESSYETVYYNEEGEVISREEALTRTLKDAEGNIACTYLALNEDVCCLSYTPSEGSVFPVHVGTYGDLDRANQAVTMINTAFAFIYLAELGIAVYFYFTKRTKA